MQEICTEQMEAWETHLANLKAERSERENAWEARRLLLENNALEVVSLAEEKILEAKSRAGATASPAASPVRPDHQEEIANLKRRQKSQTEKKPICWSGWKR